MSELKLQQTRLDGRYDIQECLGRGSYAEIYVAHDTAAADGMPTHVVIKALNVLLQGVPDAELERTLIENFQNEAVALDRVRHPNIISRLGHGTAIDLAGTTFHYLVLEYLPGGDMAAQCRERPFTLERALFYLEQVCAGLAHAHECGVIHRDIKPQNLLLTADARTVKIADFGVAKIEATEGVITRVGTNVYAAPEHNPLVHTGPLDPAPLAAARPHLTPAADIYSLAKTTYALLTGEPPRRFSRHPVTELPASISGEPWAPAVLRVLARATQTPPGERYQTVQEFWEELSDAPLPPTRPLDPRGEARPRAKLASGAESASKAPPRPQFNTGRAASPAVTYGRSSARPRIVVRVAQPETAAQLSTRPPPHARAHEIIAALPDAPPAKDAWPARKPTAAGFGTRLLVAAALIVAFAGMLLATHNYFRARWNTKPPPPAATGPAVTGREGVTTTDVNLRPDPSLRHAPVGLAEKGSRVRVLGVKNDFYEILVVQHGREKADPNSRDRGWINKRYLVLN